jgi:hypothetical protein
MASTSRASAGLPNMPKDGACRGCQGRARRCETEQRRRLPSGSGRAEPPHARSRSLYKKIAQASEGVKESLSAKNSGLTEVRKGSWVIFRQATIPVQAGLVCCSLSSGQTRSTQEGRHPHARRKGRSLDPPPLQLHPPVVITVRNSGAPPTRKAMLPPSPPLHALCHGGAPSGRASMLAGMAPSG